MSNGSSPVVDMIICARDNENNFFTIHFSGECDLKCVFCLLLLVSALIGHFSTYFVIKGLKNPAVRGSQYSKVCSSAVFLY